MLVTTVKLQDRCDTDLGDVLFHRRILAGIRYFFVFAILKLALDLNVITLLEGGGKCAKASEHDGAVPVRPRGPFTAFAVSPRVLQRTRAISGLILTNALATGFPCGAYFFPRRGHVCPI